MDILRKELSNPLYGEITIPSDKSVSHRAIIIGSMTMGKIEISNFSKGGDCVSTLNIFKNLGLEVEFKDEKTLIINSKNGIKGVDIPLDCGNSGTSMRLLSGYLAPRNFKSVLIGDVSLSKRPMKRVIEPLLQMGASIKSNDGKAPLEIFPSKLSGITYNSKIASAQVKSCLLLAGINSEGETSVIEPYLSRNHSELMLEYFNADIETGKIDNKFYSKIKKSFLEPKNLFIPGDISSAAFFICAALITKGSDIIIKNVGLNKTRTGVIDVLSKMNADIEILDLRLVNNEPIGDIRVKYSMLKGTVIEGGIIPRLIDEIPVIATLAAFADGTTIIKDAADLKNKESDRIACTSLELRKMGVDIRPTNDGFIINGNSGKSIAGGVELNCYHDHRLAMSFYIAGLRAKNPVLIKEFEWVNTSFPEFLPLFEKLGA